VTCNEEKQKGKDKGRNEQKLKREDSRAMKKRKGSEVDEKWKRRRQ